MSNPDNVHTDTFNKSTEAAAAASVETETQETATTEQQVPVQDDSAAKIEALEAELASTRDQLYRRAADFDNMRKRQERERVALFQSARIDAVKKFLAVNDDLVRTLGVASTLEIQPASFLEGVQMVATKFAQILSDYNVEPITEEGVPFNVELHDAMMRQPAPEGMSENMVLKVLDPGYRMGDTVIKHAKVIVTQ